MNKASKHHEVRDAGDPPTLDWEAVGRAVRLRTAEIVHRLTTAAKSEAEPSTTVARAATREERK